MTPAEISTAIRSAIQGAISDGELDVVVPDEVVLDRPRHETHGDWASPVAMQLARVANRPPLQIAEVLAARLRFFAGIERVDVAGPGFLNLTLSRDVAVEVVGRVLEQGEGYGANNSMQGVRINLEYVSANPTGPIHLGGARWAAVGDSLARILSICGADVTREYYFNDHGAQVERFARSLFASAKGNEAPEDGYRGEYIDRLAQKVVTQEVGAGSPNPLLLDTMEAVEVFRRVGIEIMLAEIKSSLEMFRTEFDVYFHEATLYSSGAVTEALELLRQSGRVFMRDGATWVKTSDLGDDKDRVVLKSNGEYSYIAGDIAYYLNKRRRGYDIVLMILGADHSGYVGRMKGICAAFGDDPQYNLEIRIGQMVNLASEGGAARLSKRAGSVFTLEDMVTAVGIDAARYSLVRQSIDSILTIDTEALRRKTNDNPVFYVQYAHARTRGIVRRAKELGIVPDDCCTAALLGERLEADLLGVVNQFPEIVQLAARLREPHRVARYLEELATLFHRWYDQSRVMPRAGEQVGPVHRARLVLAAAAGVVLKNGLGLLGVSAPEAM